MRSLLDLTIELGDRTIEAELGLSDALAYEKKFNEPPGAVWDQRGNVRLTVLYQVAWFWLSRHEELKQTFDEWVVEVDPLVQIGHQSKVPAPQPDPTGETPTPSTDESQVSPLEAE